MTKFHSFRPSRMWLERLVQVAIYVSHVLPFMFVMFCLLCLLCFCLLCLLCFAVYVLSFMFCYVLRGRLVVLSISFSGSTQWRRIQKFSMSTFLKGKFLFNIKEAFEVQRYLDIIYLKIYFQNKVSRKMK